MASGIKPLKIVNTLMRSRSVLAHDIAEVYKPATALRKERIIELIKEKIELARKSELAKKLQTAKGFYRLEMAPPSSQNEMKKLMADIDLVKEFMKSGCFKHLTVRQAWLLILVGTEVGLWFFLGETIGKMHFVGYKV